MTRVGKDVQKLGMTMFLTVMSQTHATGDLNTIGDLISEVLLYFMAVVNAKHPYLFK